MTATLWISGAVCRCIIRDKDGKPIDLCDEWNNVASTQSWLNDAYPEAEQRTIRLPEKRKELDEQWNSCKFGN
jgi:hypothetical protein